MFNMPEKTRKEIGWRKRRSRADSADRRQKVYAFILKNQGKPLSNKELAVAAGFDMSNSLSSSYTQGSNFIQGMLLGKHIEAQDDRNNPAPKAPKLWYITTKEKVLCSLFSKPKATEAKNETKGNERTREVVLDSASEFSVNNNTLYCFKFTVSKSGHLLENVDVELDNLTEEAILDKIKKAIKLL